MKYADFIEGNKGFQYSVNIQYDLYNASKIEGYIPTQKSIELIQEYLLNTTLKDRNKATVLIGPYGKGKSHLQLVLLSILSGLHKEQVANLVLKIKKINEKCGELIESSINSKKYLPVVLNSNSMDLNQSFLIGLRQALIKMNVDNILPRTFYDAAVDVIEGWKEYDLTYERVKELILESCNLSVDQFIKNLKSYNLSAYEIFKTIFKEITSGIEFNPFINSDIVKLYEEVNHILKDKYGYDGMIIIFDEFSKFIEASAVYNTSRDLKILQDFAELANRSDEPQIHLLCVTHKTINEYITQIPQNKVDAWRAIEGRFKEVYFNSSSQQNYELISNAIVKEEVKFNKFWEEHQSDYSKYNDESFIIFNQLYSYEDFKKVILKGCFPLSPYSAYALPKISEKVAQNERTLFTFLSKEDRYSLLDIIKNNKGEKELVTIDNLYDYFEPLLKKELFNEKINDIWIKTDTALNHVYEEKEKSIIKSLAIINIINDYKVLPPNIGNISKCIGYKKEDATNIIETLVNKGILIIRKSKKIVDFMPISGINIEEKINALVEVKMKNIDTTKVVEEILDSKYILPRNYNDKFKMVRYFNRVFMTTGELTAYDSAQLLLDNKGGDGLFVNLLIESDQDREKLFLWMKKISDTRICIVVPQNNLDIRREIGRYTVIKELLNDEELLKEDKAIESQLELLLEDIVIYIRNILKTVFAMENDSVDLYINENRMGKASQMKLSELASEICLEHYDRCPIVNNELINKNNISVPILKGRNFIVNMLLNKSYTEFDGEGNSVECTLFRTTILNKGLINLNKKIDKDLSFLFKQIKEFISESEKEEKSFSELYENIITDKYHIGIRKGVIPIYLAFVLKDYYNEAIIYIGGRKKREIPLTTEVLNNINDNPGGYFLKIEKGTKEKDDYILELEKLYKNYSNDRNSEGKYADIVKSMQAWLQSLSKYAQVHKIDLITCTELDSDIVRFRNSLVKYDINYRQFLFKDLPNLFNASTFNECLIRLKEIKIYEEDADRKLRSIVIEKTSEIINKDYKGTLPSAIKTWLLHVDDEKLNHLYDITINKALDILRENENNQEIIVSKLAYALTGLALEDWNDNSINVYINELNRVIDAVENYEIACDDGNEGVIKISFVTANGDSTEKTFNKSEITPFGSMLLNNIEESLYEFGDSIDDNEKRNILIKILEKFV